MFAYLFSFSSPHPPGGKYLQQEKWQVPWKSSSPLSLSDIFVEANIIAFPKIFFQPPGKSICFCFPYSCLSVCFVILTRKELKQNLMMAGSFLLFTFLFPFLFSGEREPILWSLKILRLFEVPTSIKKKNPNNKPNKKVFLFLPILTYSVSVFNAYN